MVGIYGEIKIPRNVRVEYNLNIGDTLIIIGKKFSVYC